MPHIDRSSRKPWEHVPDVRKTIFSKDVSFYHTTTWRKISRAYLMSHPLCECQSCQKRTVPLPSQHCDHIIPIKNGGDAYSWDNLQALNKKCHNRKSAKERL
jgi:5-methylcytosine-specific restriction endonuclease McrA